VLRRLLLENLFGRELLDRLLQKPRFGRCPGNIEDLAPAALLGPGLVPFRRQEALEHHQQRG